ncbi:MAG: DUF933 domain-containing protein [Pseudomonadota bacterium]
MQIGILGLSQSGKSTLFQIMTGVDASGSYGENYLEGIAKVPDTRFDQLVKIFSPKKISPAAIPFIDVNASGEKAWNTIRQALSRVDGIIHIIDAFSNNLDEVISKYQNLMDELILADLVLVENKLERLQKLQAKAMGPDEINQAKILPKAKELLEAGKVLSNLSLNQQEVSSLRSFCFWTLKPQLIVLNIAENSADISETFKQKTQVSFPVISICCQIEAEICKLPVEEQKEFLESAGISQPAFERIIQTSFSLLGQISYFTVGEDEVKAWVIPANSTAPKAASAIHKDFERGFIKAEVTSFADFIACGATLAAAKAKGKLRLEGKEYIVQDGDIISFRFNV